MINQNKWQSKCPFLPHVSAQTHIQFFPSHPNLWHHIIVNISLWNKIYQNTFHQNPPLLFSYQLPKIYLHFQNKKSLMKIDTIDFKSLLAFLQQLYPLHHLIISPHMLLNRKTQKTTSVWRSSIWNKDEWKYNKSKFELFDLSNFPHTLYITHTHTALFS